MLFRSIRPAFLSEPTLDVMNRLRNFRHMFRHAYGTDIELDQLRSNLVAGQKLYDLIAQDIDNFLSQLTSAEDTDE